MSEASRVTSVAVSPIASPTSASRIAGASLTPSPVIATTSPALRSSFTIAVFCAAVVRARTAPSSFKPSSRAIACAVTGWSPVIIMVRTPAARASAIADLALARGGSAQADQSKRLEIPLFV